MLPLILLSVGLAQPNSGESPAELAAWRIGGAVGNVGKGVLLNEGNSENAYSAEGVLSVGGPEKWWAIPCASKELPCGIDPCRKTKCAPGGANSEGYLVAGWVTQTPGSI